MATLAPAAPPLPSEPGIYTLVAAGILASPSPEAALADLAPYFRGDTPGWVRLTGAVAILKASAR